MHKYGLIDERCHPRAETRKIMGVGLSVPISEAAAVPEKMTFRMAAHLGQLNWGSNSRGLAIIYI